MKYSPNYTPATIRQSKDGKDWYVYFFFRSPLTGDLKMFKIRKGLNRIENLKERRREAERISAAINADLKEGWSPFVSPETKEYEGLTLLQAFEEIYKIKQSSLRHRSAQHYRSAISLFQDFLDGRNLKHITPVNFTPVLAFAFSDYLVVQKKYSGKTHNNQVGNAKNFFNILIEREVIDKNPFKSVGKKPEDIGKNIAYPDHMRDMLIEYMKGKDLPIEWAMKLQYYCMLRPNELTMLKGEHFDWEMRKIAVVSGSAKNRRQLYVEIPDVFFEELKAKYYDLPKHYYVFSKKLIPGEIRIWRNRLSEAHRKILDVFEIERKYTLYSWKHTGACAAYKAGVDIYTIMRQLRHHDLNQTMRYFKSMGLTERTEYSSKMTKF